MPLTTSPILLDDIEARKRIALDAERRFGSAAKQGVDALAMMERLAKEGRAEERQKGLDAQNTEGLVLQRKRDEVEDKRAADLHELKLITLEQAKADQAAARDGTMRLALQKVQSDVDADDAAGAERQSVMDAALAKVSESDAANTSIAPPEYTKAHADARRAAALADIAERKAAQPSAVKRVDPLKAKRERLLDAQIAKAERELNTKADGKSLPAESATKLAGKQAMLADIEAMRTAKGGVDTGPIIGPLQDLVSQVSDDPKWTAFSGRVTRFVRSMAKAQESGVLTDDDVKSWKAALVSTSTNDKAFEQVLTEIEEDLRRKLSTEATSLRLQGFNIPDAPGSGVQRTRTDAGAALNAAEIEW